MNVKKLFTVLVVAAAALVFAGCGQQSSRPVSEVGTDAGDAAGFDEFPIGDEIQLWPLNVAGVYFQPVDMLPEGDSLPASEADIHIEADISALENDLGYGAGDFVPYLTVDYEIIKNDGSFTQEGTFMPMSASDGPHYGANVKMGGAGTYKIRFIIRNPEDLGYLLHIDNDTGVTGRFWQQPLVAEWDFNYIPRVW
jgi:uncharacterized protein involved in high-affinity Fe2+ transport